MKFVPSILPINGGSNCTSEMEQKFTFTRNLPGQASQAFQESLVSYITHPDILGFNPEAGQFSPVFTPQDVSRLAEEIHTALQARKEAQEEAHGDGPELPPGEY